MEDLQVIIKMSELKEFEAKIAEAKTKEEQHKSTLKELEQLKKDLGGRKENVIRVEKHTTLRFVPSDRLARDVATSVTNNVFKVVEKLNVFSDREWQGFIDNTTPKILDTIEYSFRRHGYSEKYSEERSLGVMDFEKGSQEALEAMGTRVEKLKAELKEMGAEYYRALSEAAASTRELHALRLDIARTQEENASLKATAQKLRDEIVDAHQQAAEKRESFLNKLIRRL